MKGDGLLQEDPVLTPGAAIGVVDRIDVGHIELGCNLSHGQPLLMAEPEDAIASPTIRVAIARSECVAKNSIPKQGLCPLPIKDSGQRIGLGRYVVQVHAGVCLPVVELGSPFLKSACDVSNHTVEQRAKVAPIGICGIKNTTRLQAFDKDILQCVVELIVPYRLTPTVREVAANRNRVVASEKRSSGIVASGSGSKNSPAGIERIRCHSLSLAFRWSTW